MTKASIIVPAFNTARTLPETVAALCAQTYGDFEIVIVDDGSYDDTVKVAAALCTDPRIRLVRQANRGLAGARNSGIAAAQGEFIGFCDADDLWAPEKLAIHVAHLQANDTVGLSYSGSAIIDENSRPTGLAQRPALHGITPAQVFKRNPVGNGSAPVFRRAALDALAYRPDTETVRDWVFDETFRQSEDIECWLRLALTTDWGIEGVEGLLTSYRVNSGGLSADTERQLASWERMVTKLRGISPEFFARHESAARAYQYRYLTRRAISSLDGETALELQRACLKASLRPLIEEPRKSLVTLVAALLLGTWGPAPLRLASGMFRAPRTPA